jgi:gliding motility-associated lipoprotein GldD
MRSKWLTYMRPGAVGPLFSKLPVFKLLAVGQRFIRQRISMLNNGVQFFIRQSTFRQRISMLNNGVQLFIRQSTFRQRISMLNYSWQLSFSQLTIRRRISMLFFRQLFLRQRISMLNYSWQLFIRRRISMLNYGWQLFFRQPVFKLWVIVLVFSMACDRGYTPKPSGYIRVHYPEKEYVEFNEPAPFAFEVPVYAGVEPADPKSAEPYWYDVKFPDFRGTVHISYKPIDDDLEGYIEDTRTLVYKHTSRADGIVEVPFVDRDNRRYGILYELGGNVASPVQFFLTDSTDHFLRGSLYFNTTANRDSLNPMIRFVKQDIEHLIETVRWK